MLKSESVWTYTEKSLFPEINTMQKYGSAFTAKRTEVITNPFWKDVFKHFKEFQGKKKFHRKLCGTSEGNSSL